LEHRADIFAIVRFTAIPESDEKLTDERIDFTFREVRLDCIVLNRDETVHLNRQRAPRPLPCPCDRL
jgi:hypothetical protein